MMPALLQRVTLPVLQTTIPPALVIGTLLLAWLLPGLLGHDPWKPDEGYSMGLIHHILETGDWVVPTLAGEPFMEKPPLYYLTAAGVAQSLLPWLPLHDGARLTSGIYMALVLLCIALTGRELYGKEQGGIAMILLMGCLGLVPHAHQMITDTALLAGFACALYGLALATRRPDLGGLLLGVGAGVGFMAKGLLAPLVLGGVVCLLPLFAEWRNRRYARTLIIALLAALPWLLLWPWTLYHRHPELFQVWFWENNYGRFFGSSVLATRQETGYYLKALLWFTGPALPLAMLTLWRHRHRAGRLFPNKAGHPPLRLPLLFATVVAATLFVSSATRTLYILPLLLPIVLLATPAVTGSTPPPRLWSLALTRLFTALALLLWLTWILALLGTQPGELWQFGAESWVIPDGWGFPFQGVAWAMALLASGFWLAALPHLGRSPRTLLMGWTGGVTLLWLLLMTLWLPVIDHGKSYRSLVMGLKKALPASVSCIGSQALGEPQRAMLHYFGNILTRRLETSHSEPTCELLLKQSSSPTDGQPPAHGHLLWQGSRPGDTKEWYFLYQLPNRPNGVSK
ncbi:MAG: glycosyltransferase family 39 protein [Magnetococcus sp. MYC-9]